MGGMVEVNDSVVSPDGALKVTLIAFDPRNGQGRVKIEELHRERGRFYVTVTYGDCARGLRPGDFSVAALGHRRKGLCAC